MSLHTEIFFLETLYEQVDMGEPLFPAIIKACEQAQHTPSGELSFVGRYLKHAELNGVSRHEILCSVAHFARTPHLGHLFSWFSEYEKLGGAVQGNLEQLIQNRMFEIYTDVEKKIEAAPLKLMGPLFLFTLSGVWLFLASTIIAVTTLSAGP